MFTVVPKPKKLQKVEPIAKPDPRTLNQLSNTRAIYELEKEK